MKTKIPVIDLHCDIAYKMPDGRSLYQNDGTVSIQNLQKGGVFCQAFALYIDMRTLTDAELAYNHLHHLHDILIREIDLYKNFITVISNAQDIEAAQAEGKISALITVEEGGVLNNKIERLDELYNIGARLITISWNVENCIGFPHLDLENRGLKPFGKDVLQKMEELGMIVDVSHLCDRGFWDVVDICKKPFVASHSNAREICPHSRNLDDKMLKAVANKGGVVGLNFHPKFLGGEGGIKDLILHIKHIHNIAGTDVIAFGSDFDGFEASSELVDCSGFPLLIDALEKSGFSSAEIEKICWKNAMRVIKEIL